MSEKIKEDLSKIGRNPLETFVQERIKSGKVNFWSPMKQRKLLTWKTNAKVLKVSTKEKVVELRKDRSLFARMIMVCKSRPEIDIKETAGQYEFSLVPRSLFAADGSMLHYSSKSDLLAILEKLVSETNDHSNGTTGMSAPQMKVTILDGMAELQSLDKPYWIKNSSRLADHFNSRIYHISTVVYTRNTRTVTSCGYFSTDMTCRYPLKQPPKRLCKEAKILFTTRSLTQPTSRVPMKKASFSHQNNDGVNRLSSRKDHPTRNET